MVREADDFPDPEMMGEEKLSLIKEYVASSTKTFPVIIDLPWCSPAAGVLFFQKGKKDLLSLLFRCQDSFYALSNANSSCLQY